MAVGGADVRSAARPGASSSRHYLRVALVVFAAYLVAGKLGQATTHIRSSNLGPVWPAYGVALASVVLFGARVWPSLIAAAFVVALSSPVGALTAAGQAAASTLAALTGGALLERFGFDRSLARLRDAITLMILGALVSAMVSASIGVLVLYATGVQAYNGIASAWLIYWLGDSTGVLLVTPLVLTMPMIRPSGIVSRGIEFGVLMACLTITCFLIFGDWELFPVKLHVLAFAVLPFVIWSAIRFAVPGVTLATLIVAAVATVETALGSGPFSQGTTFTNAILLDVFFAVLSVSGIMLAAVIAERERVEAERARLVREQVAHEAVRESEDKLRLILESTAEAIFGTDREGRCTFCNPACVRALGYDHADQLLGRDMHALIHYRYPDGRPYPVEECPKQAVFRTGTGVHVDDDVLWRKDGSSFPAECWVHPQFKGQRVVGAVVAFIDITQRKQAELQVASLREELVHLGRVAMLDALAGSLAHEINQPLTAVTANAEAALRLMAEVPPPLDELRAAVADIRSDNQRAGDVVHRLRTLLKRGVSRHEPFDVNGAVTEVVQLLKGSLVSRRVTIDVESRDDLPPILGDRIQFQQVLLNLLMNAADALQGVEPSQRRITLRSASRNPLALVQVIDRGSGLSDDEIARIFEPFYTTKPDGMGLGLAICRTIVQAHGGALDAERNPEGGMTFSATFRLAVESPAAAP
jgi:PAS domain S-box-containing protein